MSELREALEAAYDANETEDAAEGVSERAETHTEEPVRAAAKEEGTERGESGRSDNTRDDGRDSDGRFAKRAESLEEAKAVKHEAEVAETGQPTEQQHNEQIEALKPPASWKPTAREHWKSIPPDVQQEIVRRERESQQLLQDTTQSRHAASALAQLSQKYAATMAAEGAPDILTATDNLAQIATRLRFGGPGEKANQIASLIKAYGVDIMQLDNILAGLPAQPAAMQQQNFQDPRLDRLLQEAEQTKRQREEQAAYEAQSEVHQFGANKEFFSDVRGMMADLVEVAARSGIDLSLQDAYDRAIQLHPEINKVVGQRAQAEQARNPHRSTAKAKAAASSVKGSPSPGTARATGGSTRDDILAAMEQAEGR
jgi:hypothetical protein